MTTVRAYTSPRARRRHTCIALAGWSNLYSPALRVFNPSAYCSMRNAAELRMTPSRCRSRARWRVLQPGRSSTYLVSEGFRGSRAAQANHRANASTTATTSLKNVRMEYSSLDDERHLCAARQDKERGPSGPRLLHQGRCQVEGNSRPLSAARAEDVRAARGFASHGEKRDRKSTRLN